MKTFPRSVVLPIPGISPVYPGVGTTTGRTRLGHSIVGTTTGRTRLGHPIVGTTTGRTRLGHSIVGTVFDLSQP
ncbi:MAG: hypothetical protein H7A55_22365 [Verrucomicrobiaceae bacterium]|nr:hypothetical protein [Verrucomicrobiaceae bacterium]